MKNPIVSLINGQTKTYYCLILMQIVRLYCSKVMLSFSKMENSTGSEVIDIWSYIQKYIFPVTLTPKSFETESFLKTHEHIYTNLLIICLHYFTSRNHTQNSIEIHFFPKKNYYFLVLPLKQLRTLNILAKSEKKIT